MKPLIFLVLFLVALLLFTTSDIKEVSDEDLIASLSEHPELYDYYDFSFSDKKIIRYKDRTEVEFAYRFTRQAKRHIAIIEGESVAVDNAFVNSCFEHTFAASSYGSDPCQFVTEMGTVEQVQGDHAYLTVDRWGRFSLHNLQKALLSEKVFGFLTRFITIFEEH